MVNGFCNRSPFSFIVGRWRLADLIFEVLCNLLIGNCFFHLTIGRRFIRGTTKTEASQPPTANHQRNISGIPKNSDKILNFAVRLYYQLSYNYSAQYNMLLINALGIH
jgi:hypothetical protein